MSDFESKRQRHALQPDEKVDIMFWVMKFRLKNGRDPTVMEVKAWWVNR